MAHDIIDNRHEKLAEHINRILSGGGFGAGEAGEGEGGCEVHLHNFLHISELLWRFLINMCIMTL